MFNRFAASLPRQDFSLFGLHKSSHAVAALALACDLLLSGCGAAKAPAVVVTRTPLTVPVPNISPHLPGVVQGVAVDQWGDYYVTFTNSIAAYDSNWNLLWTNSSPFAGIGVTVNHIGDFEYANGLIYAPVEKFSSCSQFSPVLIVVYDATNGRLVNWVDITADAHEASAIAVVPDSAQVVVSSYCPANNGSSTFWSYDLSAVNTNAPGSVLANESTITLSAPVQYIQGISWDPLRSRFLMSADIGSPAGTLWLVDPSGTVTGPVFKVPGSVSAELEGVDATTGNAYYEENGYVYGMGMP